MPVLLINTNLPKSQIPEGFLLKASKEAARIIGKPELYISVIIKPDQIMSFSGSTEPCAIVEAQSIGTFLGNKNQQIATELMNLITSELKIAKDRFYVVLTDLRADRVSFQGNLFG